MILSKKYCDYFHSSIPCCALPGGPRAKDSNSSETRWGVWNVGGKKWKSKKKKKNVQEKSVTRLLIRFRLSNRNNCVSRFSFQVLHFAITLSNRWQGCDVADAFHFPCTYLKTLINFLFFQKAKLPEICNHLYMYFPDCGLLLCLVSNPLPIYQWSFDLRSRRKID